MKRRRTQEPPKKPKNLLAKVMAPGRVNNQPKAQTHKAPGSTRLPGALLF